MGLELIVMSVSIVALFFLLMALLLPSQEPEIKTQGFLTRMIGDGNFTGEEYMAMSQLSCADLKALLGTGKEVCIYFKDSNGNVVDISGDGSFGIGCPGLEIEGKKICNK